MNSLDLHGVKHSDVKQLLDNFIWENMKENITEIEIITGISVEMKRIVSIVLHDYDMVYQETPFNPGSVSVKLK